MEDKQKPKFEREQEVFTDNPPLNDVFDAEQAAHNARQQSHFNQEYQDEYEAATPPKLAWRTTLELFGKPEWQSFEFVKKQYYRLAKQHHPDVEGGSEERFKAIQQAFEDAKEFYNQPK